MKPILLDDSLFEIPIDIWITLWTESHFEGSLRHITAIATHLKWYLHENT